MNFSLNILTVQISQSRPGSGTGIILLVLVLVLIRTSCNDTLILKMLLTYDILHYFYYYIILYSLYKYIYIKNKQCIQLHNNHKQ